MKQPSVTFPDETISISFKSVDQFGRTSPMRVTVKVDHVSGGSI
jgi:hypothetical protein